MAAWAIDLGNSHTRVARWDDSAAEPRLIELPEICRRPGGNEPLEAPRLIPSATHVLEKRGFRGRIADWPLVRRFWTLGREALIGRQAVEHNAVVVHPNYVPTFKPFLEREALRTVARAGAKTYTVRDVARRFVRELLVEVQRVTGERVRDVVLTTPVEAYETYRAELLRIARALGVKRVRFVDEPVAAAAGYGLSASRGRVVLVVDFGGGTFHLAVVALSPKETTEGRGSVIAKAGRAVGGNLVNGWVLADVCRRLSLPLDEPSAQRVGGGAPTQHEDPQDAELSFWHRLMMAEACRVKEAVFFNPSTTFLMAPPPQRAGLPVRTERLMSLEYTRDDLVAVLEANRLYERIQGALDGVLAESAAVGIHEKNIDDVLMVGGSTLLPEVYPTFERRFGRDRVRAWQPFEAVAYGAAAFAAGHAGQTDFIVHDYAFVTYNADTHKPEYTVIVPRGTRFPTEPDLWKRQLVPTCSLGEPETFFKLVICEVGRNGDERKFMWDEKGVLHALGAGERASEPVVVSLNESNPTLGYLNPPHSPRDKRPRLEISFGVNAERWLCATVYDLRKKAYLLKNASVVRLV